MIQGTDGFGQLHKPLHQSKGIDFAHPDTPMKLSALLLIGAAAVSAQTDCAPGCPPSWPGDGVCDTTYARNHHIRNHNHALMGNTTQ